MTEASQNEASSSLVAWGGVSRTTDLGGPVHYVDFGGAAGAPRVVLAHGLSGSHLNWCLLAPRLVAQVRVLAVLDWLGTEGATAARRAAEPAAGSRGGNGPTGAEAPGGTAAR